MVTILQYVYRVRSNNLSLRTDIKLTRNNSKISSITFTKYKTICKSLLKGSV